MDLLLNPEVWVAFLTLLALVHDQATFSGIDRCS